MNRDQLHAAGGSFVNSQLAKEQDRQMLQKQPAESNRAKKAILTQAEDFKLTTWMHQRTPKWGEKASDIFAEALVELNIPNLNKDHIYNRLNAHAETLPKAIEPVSAGSIEERLDNLERFAILMYEYDVNGNSIGADDGRWLSEYIAKNSNGRKSIVTSTARS